MKHSWLCWVWNVCETTQQRSHISSVSMLGTLTIWSWGARSNRGTGLSAEALGRGWAPHRPVYVEKRRLCFDSRSVTGVPSPRPRHCTELGNKCMCVQMHRNMYLRTYTCVYRYVYICINTPLHLSFFLSIYFFIYLYWKRWVHTDMFHSSPVSKDSF